MCETPYKHKKNVHCRSLKTKIFKLLSALSILALPSSGHRGIGSVAHRWRPGAAARRVSRGHGGTSHRQGSWWGNPALPQCRDGLGAVTMPGDAAGGQQGWLQEPAGSFSLPHPSLGSPVQGHGTTTFFRVWQKTWGAGSLSLRQLPEAL